MDHRGDIGKIILNLAEMYGEEFTEPRLKAYINALEDLDIKEIELAHNYFTKESDSRFMPLPPAIRKVARPSLSNKQQAIRILNHIQDAVKLYGYSNDLTAAKYLNHHCWDIVNKLGGWRSLCYGDRFNDSAGYAQLRDQVEAIVSSQRLGINYEALPEAETPAQIENKKRIDSLCGRSGKDMSV